jgi:hypothetical protein
VKLDCHDKCACAACSLGKGWLISRKNELILLPRVNGQERIGKENSYRGGGIIMKERGILRLYYWHILM